VKEIWQLVVTDTHGIFSKVCGNEEILRTFIEEWKDVSILNETVLSVIGVYDDFARGACEIYIKKEEIVSISLLLLNKC
jgi:hypothetical protein